MEALVAAPGGPADAGEREGPDRGADRRKDRVPPEGHLEDACRNRDERTDHRRDASHQGGEVVPAVEPTRGPFELVVREVHPASAPLEERPPTIEPDRPAADRAREVAERAGEGDDDEPPEMGVDPMAEEDDVLTC